MTETVRGTAAPRFDKVRAMLAENIETGEELGASLVVDLLGEPVVDLWGGYADVARATAWSEDTIVNVWSCTKTVTNLAALILVDRGVLDLHAPVATYWPEFAANGKESIELRHIMSHTSGVSGWESPWSTEDMYDWDRATGQLADQAPWWEPGTASGYHGSNMGHLVGEVIRRVTGLTLKDFVRTEIAEPLDADFQIGARADDLHRVAEIVPPPPLDIDLSDVPADHPMIRTLTGPLVDAASANTAGWRDADMGAMNGHGNARSLARVMSALSLGGTVNGTRLLGPKTIELIFQQQAAGADLVLGIPLRWGIGYALPDQRSVPSIPDEKICFWGGWGGSMIVMHPERGLTISYVMNKMAGGIIGSDRSNAYISAIYEALD